MGRIRRSGFVSTADDVLEMNLSFSLSTNITNSRHAVYLLSNDNTILQTDHIVCCQKIYNMTPLIQKFDTLTQ